ncbi:Pre-rRNA-processing protein ipi3 [Elasticomyces elasticus]|uniref:Pre-rRNA-processing protein IPI3 n=1 Tax=Exophiala sideris TaxID=1016849 RepID=A0ABR0JDA1_9EURO|nr:Pre-rRNA-processing protein ipi3 [Elasticomyces elasticus]KAK5031804.1 Pre-rRNA-processing protein ipi3 [Exophiala sideris]KAK5040733.1 Pre-rRNA-processing protein ipi3 [Exophiala sideris]KAK5061933.1 Pre-rRNA-processing protein ipi3 [Exophiala sideris]KAK5184633.1 Pre-rRNA-processing protein ipi3 [Eurotiomycetes sp. CCFEE 6388]
MLTETFVAATLTANKAVAHASASLKDVGIFLHEFQPQSTFRHGYKKSSSRPGCVAITDSHIFAAQADKAVINVYSRERGNQEATVPFPERIHSLAFAQNAAILVLGTEGGKLIIWEVATGRLTSSAAAHLQSASCLCITPKNEYIISGSADSSLHVWSLLKLVSLLQPTDNLETQEPSRSPIHTFSGHRSAVSAVDCGHSKVNTNFAVSASEDATCHLWHIQSGQILRTLLLPSVAVSITLDPADRAIYFGCNDGRIQSFDIFRQAQKEKSSLSGSAGAPAIQLRDGDSWVAPTTDIGAAHSLTLSYDGSTLLSGHQNGAIVHWDVAKHRIVNEITNLGQPVTHIEMLEPEGFVNRPQPRFTVVNVVKPNLELTSSVDHGTCGVPAKYNLHVRQPALASELEMDTFEQAIVGAGFPQAMLDEALRSITIGEQASLATNTNGSDKGKAERLEDELCRLKQQVAVLQNVEQKHRQKKVARMKLLEEIDLEKRKAYFEAKKRGEDGDAAMKAFEEKKALVELESDEDDSDVHMDVG